MSALVMVVEDTLDSQILAKKILQNAGYNAIITGDAKSTLDMCSQVTPDIIMMDISLPDMSGKDLAKKLRKIDKLKEIPIIATTAHAFIEEEEAIYKNGMNGFLSKPFSPSQLIKKIKKYI
ncbi:MAG: response regulator [Candidatus Cloacimonadota bacterium]|nr:response regulator [Candidatus Cloacimonadota bacterium]